MRFESNLTEKNKNDILSLFFRTKLREGEKIINNTDGSIAKELGLKTKEVSFFIYDFLNRKYSKLNDKINKNN